MALIVSIARFTGSFYLSALLESYYNSAGLFMILNFGTLAFVFRLGKGFEDRPSSVIVVA